VPDLDPVTPPANPELELEPGEDESTVGTGSVLAIGCSVIVLLAIIVGIALVFAH